MKTISVLLTKYSDFISCFLYHFAGHGYTHASLGLEEEDAQFYSFNREGFCTETTEKHLRRGVHMSICYKFQVPEAVYLNIRQQIEEVKRHRNEYQYTRMGALFAMLHIPFHWEKHYICSQFVAELLIESGAVSLQKNASLYLPNQFRSEFEHTSSLSQIVYNPLRGSCEDSHYSSTSMLHGL